MEKIKLAIAGVGNCANSLAQGIEYYKHVDAKDCIGLMHSEINGYRPGDIEVVAAFDVDRRKVGKDLSEAVFAEPNCTSVFYRVPYCAVEVKMGPVLDGVAPHMHKYPEDKTFVVADEEPYDVVKELEDSGAEILVNYMPVGSEQATRFYAKAALEAGVAFVNCMPVFIASDPEWGRRFEERKLPVVGDDVKSQFGATIVHRIFGDIPIYLELRLSVEDSPNSGGSTIDAIRVCKLARDRGIAGPLIEISA